VLSPLASRLGRVKRAAVAAAGVFRPFGYGGYARLRFLPDPAFDGQSECDVEGDAERSDEEQMRMLLEVLATHTRTPEDCYFCLWDGYGDIHGGTCRLGGPFQRGWTCGLRLLWRRLSHPR